MSPLKLFTPSQTLFCCAVLLFTTAANTAIGESNCFLTNDSNGLPVFQGYGYRESELGRPSRRIHHQHQAIITSYKFNCCGNITEWGVDLNPDGTAARFDFTLQVWRPSSPTENVSQGECYDLINEVLRREIDVRDEQPVARVIPLPQDQLQFQPGDVLGFYVESVGQGDHSGGDADNGVVILDGNELVWFASIEKTAVQPSQSVNCPYPVGTNGVLNSSTHAAPVISINITALSCPRSTSLLDNIDLVPTSVMISSMKLQTLSSSTVVPPQIILASHPNNNNGLIAGVSVAIVLIVCVTIAATIIITAILIVKKQQTKQKSNMCNTAISNQVYGASEINTAAIAYECPISSATLQSHYATIGEDTECQSVGPDTCKPHVHVSDPLRNGSDIYEFVSDVGKGIDVDCTGCAYETPHSHEKVMAHEIPSVSGESFDTAGIYVPTAEERSHLEDHYEAPHFSTEVYNKLKFFTEDQLYWAPATTTSELYSQLASKKYREIPREQIRIEQAIGSGEFGNVCKAQWSISGNTKEVAVKTLKPGSLENDRVRFLQEAAIMGQFNHPHVVKLYGVVTVGDPIMVCIELMINGDLRDYLGTITSNKHTVKVLELQLLKFSRQIASGMAYLSKKAFVHRDLAARNILLDASLTCKISDFGMARDLADDTYYTVQSKGNKIPVKWTAPEALFYKKYSTDSDAWSFGMVLFEIWSVGKKPFSEISNKEVMSKINSGYCQPPPPGCPRPIYHLMVDCWNPIHSQCPSFFKISATLNASNSTLLQWTGGEYGSDAGELGGQLSDASFLYLDLQNTYTQLH